MEKNKNPGSCTRTNLVYFFLCKSNLGRGVCQWQRLYPRMPLFLLTWRDVGWGIDASVGGVFVCVCVFCFFRFMCFCANIILFCVVIYLCPSEKWWMPYHWRFARASGFTSIQRAFIFSYFMLAKLVLFFQLWWGCAASGAHIYAFISLFFSCALRHFLLVFTSSTVGCVCGMGGGGGCFPKVDVSVCVVCVKTIKRPITNLWQASYVTYY